jgi:flagellar hook-associated protein 1 FlgK
MSLDLAFGIARTGLQATQRALAQVSQNIANADTPGYTRKDLAPIALQAADRPMGLRLGEARRLVDDALVAERDWRGAEAAAAGLRETLLGSVDAAHGRPEDGDSLGDVVAGLRAAFIGLRAAPGEAGVQRDVLRAAHDVATRFNEVAGAIGKAREQAQRGIGEELARVNQGLRGIADLSTRIRADRSAGLSTADLEDQRDTALSTLSRSLPVKALRQADGGILLIARGGLALPLDAERDAFSTQAASIGPQSFHGAAGTLPGVRLQGVDVTAQLAGGRLAELVRLRDSTLPRYQAEMDVAASAMATRLDAQGLRLFTDAAGAVPDTSLPYAAGGQLGFANAIRVNPALLADPRLLRDGTQDVTAATGGPTAFIRNPAGGPAGFTTLLDRVLDHGLGETVRAGTAWAALPSSGLGPDGSLSSHFLPPGSIEAYSAAVTGAQTADRAAAAADRTRAEAMRRGLDARFQQQSGVDPDAEMARLVQLQNAYAVNARVMNTAQQMWDQLLNMVR